tara:strand:+ start:3392 stop:3865 length:474 start_codon:yes stop_codon:yes gene_type:complete
MRIEIENYRGWDILFNTDTEKFYVMSEDIDLGKDKPSFKSCKKFVDDYIKNNVDFKTFEVQRFGRYDRSPGVIKTVVGVRKDGRFVCVDEKGNIEQISDYETDNYIVVKESNKPIFEKMAKKLEEIGNINSSIKELSITIDREMLVDLKEKYKDFVF